MMHITLRNPENGEMVCVPKPKGTLDLEAIGHAGWELLEQREGPPPACADWVEGEGFVVDEALAAEKAEEARLNALSRKEFMEEVDSKMVAQAEAHLMQINEMQSELAKRDVQISELAQAGGMVITPVSDIVIDPGELPLLNTPKPGDHVRKSPQAVPPKKVAEGVKDGKGIRRHRRRQHGDPKVSDPK